VSALFFALIIAYNIYALITLWKRPGFFAATILCSYGLAVFFGPSGTVAAAVGVFAVAGARLAGTKPLGGLANAEVPLLLFIAIMLGGAIFSTQLDATSNYVSLFVGLALITYLHARTFANHPTFVRDFFWGSAFITTLTFIQLVRTSTKLQRIGASSDAGLNPIGLANLCEIGFACGVAALMFDRELRLEMRIAIFLFIILVVIPFILTTATRSVAVSCAVVFICFALLFVRHSSARARLMFAGGTIVGLPILAAGFIAFAPRKLLLLIAQGVFRFGGNAAGGGFAGGRSTDERFSSYQAAYDIFKNAPIFGNGIGSYGYLADGPPGVYPHNIELELMVSGGIIGLVLFALFLAPPFVSALREALRKDLRWERIAIGGILLSTFIRHQFSFTFAAGKLLFFTTGCFIAWQLAERRDAAAAAAPPPPEEDAPAALPGPA
jgi:O-antigen ligase